MSLIIDREKPHNALWYTPPGASAPTTAPTSTRRDIPTMTPEQYIELIRHRYRHTN